MVPIIERHCINDEKYFLILWMSTLIEGYTLSIILASFFLILLFNSIKPRLLKLLSISSSFCLLGV